MTHPLAENLWSWRESNPRPNRETICFLHAYFGLNFRDVTRPEPPITPLSSKFHHCNEAYNGYFRLYSTALSESFGTRASGRCLVSTPSVEIRQVIYYDSIKLRERNYFRQLNCWSLIFRSQTTKLRMLTYHLGLLSNPVNPLNDDICCDAKLINIFLSSNLFVEIFLFYLFFMTSS